MLHILVPLTLITKTSLKSQPFGVGYINLVPQSDSCHVDLTGFLYVLDVSFLTYNPHLLSGLGLGSVADMI